MKWFSIKYELDNDLYKYGKICICKQYCLHYLYKYERTFIYI